MYNEMAMRAEHYSTDKDDHHAEAMRKGHA